MAKSRNINYKTLSTKIIETIERIVDGDDGDRFRVSLQEHYSDSLNEAIITYKYYMRDVKNNEAADALNIRTILVEVFREIEESDRDEAIDILSDRLKKEYNSVKRRERYKREKAQAEGKEYVSELVDFKDIDESKEIIEDIDEIKGKTKSETPKIKINTPSMTINKEVTKTTEDFNIYDELNKQKAEEFGKLVEQQQAEDLDEPENSITSVKVNQSNIIKKSTQTKQVPINDFVSEPEFEPEELFDYPDEVIKLNGYEFNLDHRTDRSLVLYRLDISGTGKLGNILPFIPNVISNVSIPMYVTQKGAGNVNETINKHKWQIRLNIATNENIQHTIEKLRGFRQFKGASFNFKIYFKVRNKDEIFLIKI